MMILASSRRTPGPIRRGPSAEARCLKPPATTTAAAYGSRLALRLAGTTRILTHLQRHPAIDHQFDAGDVFRLVGSEKQRGVGDVPGFPHVSHRHLRIARAPHRLDIALG